MPSSVFVAKKEKSTLKFNYKFGNFLRQEPECFELQESLPSLNKPSSEIAATPEAKSAWTVAAGFSPVSSARTSPPAASPAAHDLRAMFLKARADSGAEGERSWAPGRSGRSREEAGASREKSERAANWLT